MSNVEKSCHLYALTVGNVKTYSQVNLSTSYRFLSTNKSKCPLAFVIRPERRLPGADYFLFDPLDYGCGFYSFYRIFPALFYTIAKKGYVFTRMPIMPMWWWKEKINTNLIILQFATILRYKLLLLNNLPAFIDL